LGERVGVVALVVVVHVGLALVWLMQPEPRLSRSARCRGLSRFSRRLSRNRKLNPSHQNRSRGSSAPRSQLRNRRCRKSQNGPAAGGRTARTPVSPPVQAALPAVAAAPVIDTAPDYKAAYLNNPRPSYPMAARRMGWEGRVVLNVEVLATGYCGDANVFQSSGHDVLTTLRCAP